jgi:hypothetical protein
MLINPQNLKTASEYFRVDKGKPIIGRWLISPIQALQLFHRNPKANYL